jgi:hypothetical protein
VRSDHCGTARKALFSNETVAATGAVSRAALLGEASAGWAAPVDEERAVFDRTGTPWRANARDVTVNLSDAYEVS